MYTGRKIAIITDIHGLLEPLEATLIELKKRGITEIYSLGDNVGMGPNSLEVVLLLKKYNVKSIAGNSEDYQILGLEPFYYLRGRKNDDVYKTGKQLGKEGLDIIKEYPHSLILNVGGKKVGLIHFPNDVRYDFGENSTWSYQYSIANFGHGYEQFLKQNPIIQHYYLKNQIERNGDKEPYMRGMISAYNEPLLKGKPLTSFDDIFFGHVHFRIEEQTETTKFHGVRALGMGNVFESFMGKTLNKEFCYREPKDEASFIILNEKDIGFDIERVSVKFDYEKMLNKVRESDSLIYKYVAGEELSKSR